jgi:hypothetical protein
VADGIIFEKLGVQTATLVTDAFTASGNAMARRMGMPGYHYAMLPHPVANLTPEECKERARELVPEILEILGMEAQPEQPIADRQRTVSTAEQVPWPGGGSV